MAPQESVTRKREASVSRQWVLVVSHIEKEKRGGERSPRRQTKVLKSWDQGVYSSPGRFMAKEERVLLLLEPYLLFPPEE